MPHARNAYLEAQILTATPQKLRLLLIDGAIRFARAAIQSLEEGSDAAASEQISRCRQVVTELMSSLTLKDTVIFEQLTAVYAFLFHALAQAQLRHEPSMLREVVRVLEEERETWQQVCVLLPDSNESAYHPASNSCFDENIHLGIKDEAAARTSSVEFNA